MPNNGNGEGTFQPENLDVPELNYRLESWVELGNYPERLHSISDSDLPNVDFMIFEVWGDDPSNFQHVTVWGPGEDWSYFENVLGEDFGVDGSLLNVFYVPA